MPKSKKAWSIYPKGAARGTTKKRRNPALRLFKFNKRSGIWDVQRVCADDTGPQWLAYFQKEYPGDHFKLSRNKPTGYPK